MEFGEGGEIYICFQSILFNPKFSFFLCDDQILCLSGSSSFTNAFPTTHFFAYLFIYLTSIFSVPQPQSLVEHSCKQTEASVIRLVLDRSGTQIWVIESDPELFPHENSS